MGGFVGQKKGRRALGTQRQVNEELIVVTHQSMTEFRQPIRVQSHLEMPGILVQLGRIQRT